MSNNNKYFSRVKKKDNRIVAFNKRKIGEAIFKAAQSVGGKNRKIAQILADEVVEYMKTKFSHGSVPGVEDIHDAVEKVLIEEGHALTAKAYILYREHKRGMRERLKVRKEVRLPLDTTDLSLLVYAPRQGEIGAWDKERIVKALTKEAKISPSAARKIANNVERKLLTSEMKEISTSLIRELVDNELFALGYGQKLRQQRVMGMPRFDLDQLIFSKSVENSNISCNNPEAVNLEIAEHTLKQYALETIFSQDVTQAHLRGAMHIHDLGYPCRVYCSAHSLEYIKKYGLELGNLNTISKPAKHARTLTGHLNTFLASMQAYYAGALGIGFLNVFYAPYLVGMSFKEMKQEAQYLIYSGSQNAFSRGGQSLFLDANIHLGIPEYLRNIPAIGPGGEYTGKTYREYAPEAQQFARALLEVWKEGDTYGHVFSFPKCDMHITKETFEDPEQYELLKFACEVASYNGSPYFVFDRDNGATLSACCRLRTKIKDKYMVEHPESMRYCGFQNITINLPQAAYRAGKGNVERLFQEIDRTMELAMKTHFQKRKFIQRLMSNKGYPLWQVGKDAKDGRPYIDLDKVTHIIGLIGLNECLQYLIGKQLHEDEEVYKMGLKIVASMHLKTQEFEKKYGLHVALEESPAESATRRLAKIDLREYPQSREVIKGDIDREEQYYTNSIHYAASVPLSLFDRIVGQGRFHPLIESGAITHAFIGEEKPSPEAILSLVRKTWELTPTAQLTISPEFTICNQCNKMNRGLAKTCPSCGSRDVYGITRIVGYFSRISNWNLSKIGELKERHKGNYRLGEL